LEQTLVLLKPDAVQRGLIGTIISRLELRGLRLVGAKFVAVDLSLAERHYAIHQGKPFYNGLIKYIIASDGYGMGRSTSHYCSTSNDGCHPAY
jgi:nucleoside-diphosphate kinase